MENYNLQEASKLLRISSRTLSGYIKKGYINPKKVKSSRGTTQYCFTKENLQKLRQILNRPDLKETNEKVKPEPKAESVSNNNDNNLKSELLEIIKTQQKTIDNLTKNIDSLTKNIDSQSERIREINHLLARSQEQQRLLTESNSIMEKKSRLKKIFDMFHTKTT